MFIPMTKVNEKIKVDSYTEDFSNHILICQCSTPNDEELIEKYVTITELHDHVCEKGKVNTSHGEDIEPVSFWAWYDENRLSEVVNVELTDIINRRECRKADFDTMITNRIALLKSELGITNKKAS